MSPSAHVDSPGKHEIFREAATAIAANLSAPVVTVREIFIWGATRYRGDGKE